MYIYITWRFHPVDTGEVARWKFLAHYPVYQTGYARSKEGEKRKMGNEQFLKACKKILVKYINEHLDPTDGVKIDETNIYPVWLTKVLKNNKGLFSTYSPDGYQRK